MKSLETILEPGVLYYLKVRERWSDSRRRRVSTVVTDDSLFRESLDFTRFSNFPRFSYTHFLTFEIPQCITPGFVHILQSLQSEVEMREGPFVTFV